MEKKYGALTNEQFLRLSDHKSNIAYVKALINDLLLIHENPWDKTTLEALRRQIQFIEITYPLPVVELSDKEREFLSISITRDIYKNLRKEITAYERISYKNLLIILNETRDLWLELSRVHAEAINTLYLPLLEPENFTKELASRIQEDLLNHDSSVALDNLLYNAKHICEIRALLRFKGIDPDLFNE
jgi:hypothetical protein